MNEKIRRQAAMALFKLAEKAEQRGSDGNLSRDTPLPPGWVLGGDDLRSPVHPQRLQEAVAFCDLALEILPEGYLYYRQALLLEKLSDFEAAMTAHEKAKAVGYDAAGYCNVSIERCRGKLQGTRTSQAALEGLLSDLILKINPDDEVVRTVIAGNPGLFEEAQSAWRQALQATAKLPDFKPQTDVRSAHFESDEQAEGMDSALHEAAAVDFAENFCWHLVDGQFDQAHQQLSSHLKEVYTPEALRKRFSDMVEWIESGVDNVEAMSNTMTDFPDRQAEDVLWVYVSVDGDDGAEAVSMVVRQGAESLEIRDIEWGRP